MKKKLLILIALLLMIPSFVLADAGMPERIELDAKVTNPEGAKKYKYDYENGNSKYTETGETVPYDHIIKIYDEYNYYAYVVDENEWYYVKIEDVEYILDESKYTYKDSSIYTLLDAEVYKQPSMGAEVIGTIPAGKKIDSKTAIYNDKIMGEAYAFNGWEYVEYENIKGWVYTASDDRYGLYGDDKSLYGKVADYNDSKIIIANQNAILYESPIKQNQINILPENAEYKAKYYYYNRVINESFYYIETNDIAGWVNVNNVGVEPYNHYIKTVFALGNTTPVYNNLNVKSISDSIGNLYDNVKIQKLKEYDVLYTFSYNFYYVNIDGAKYWIKPSVENNTIIKYNEYEIEIDDLVAYYSDVNCNEESMQGTLKPGKYTGFNIVNDYNYQTGEDNSIYYFKGYGFVKTGVKYDITESYEYQKIQVKFLGDTIFYNDEYLEEESGKTLKMNDVAKLNVAFVRNLENGDKLYYDKSYGYFALGFPIENIKYLDTKVTIEKEKQEQKLTALYIIGGAVVLAAAATVTIILVVKKKKNKNTPETPVEAPKEEVTTQVETPNIETSEVENNEKKEE